MTSRRELLRSMAAAAAAAALPSALGACGSPTPRPASPLPTLRREPTAQRGAPGGALREIGVQLYTLRGEMRTAPEATIGRIATVGFDEIEWWGEWQRTPAQLRAVLDDHGLRSPAAHIDPRDLAPERLPALLDRAQVMGHTSLIVAWTPPAQRGTDDFRRLAAVLSEAGRRAASVGIHTGYHNHDFEFEAAAPGEPTRLEILLAESDPEVVDLELDCFWALKAGHDPIALLRQHRDRITHLHLKDSSGPPEHTQMDVGDGVIDWRALIDVATAGRVRHAFVEHDGPADAWATVSAGLGHLRDLGY